MTGLHLDACQTFPGPEHSPSLSAANTLVGLVLSWKRRRIREPRARHGVNRSNDCSDTTDNCVWFDNDRPLARSVLSHPKLGWS